MEALINFFDHLVTSGGVSGLWLASCLGIAGVGALFFYVTKSIMMLSTYFKAPATQATKADLDLIKDYLNENNKYLIKGLEDGNIRMRGIEEANSNVIELSRKIENEIEKVNNLIDNLKDMQDEDLRTSTNAARDLGTLVNDSRSRFVEVTRQVQQVQVDLASLTGTIIGMGSGQRTRLK
jgi:hypothetical protein